MEMSNIRKASDNISQLSAETTETHISTLTVSEKFENKLAVESIQLLQKSIENLKSHEYNTLADSILKTLSKLSLQEDKEIEEIRNKIARIDENKKLNGPDGEEVKILLTEVEGHLEEILANKHEDLIEKNNKLYPLVAKKLCKALTIMANQLKKEAKHEEYNLEIPKIIIEPEDSTCTMKSNDKKKWENPQATESLALVQNSFSSLKSHDYNTLANTILKTLSKVSFQEGQQLEEIKNKIDQMDRNKRLSNLKMEEAEILLKEVGGHLEEILANKHEDLVEKNQKLYLVVVKKLGNLLSMMLDPPTNEDKPIGNNLKVPGSHLDSDNISKTSSILYQESYEHQAQETLKKDENERISNFSDKSNQKVCHCFSTNNLPGDSQVCCHSHTDSSMTKSENPESVYSTSNTDSDMSKSEDSQNEKLIENPIDNKSHNSLITRNISEEILKSIKSLENLSNVNSNSNLYNVITVASVPTVISVKSEIDEIHDPKNSLKEEADHLMKPTNTNETEEDLNDDGFGLPKVPSDLLSEASSAVWIDENASFIPHGEEALPLKIEHHECEHTDLLDVPEDSIQSSSRNSEPTKRHSLYCRCKTLVKRLSGVKSQNRNSK